ncbi:DUF5685 family protein [Herpetosiphon sp.]|uniref:Expression regulator n=1 Tax=Herpetosiphon aurantiacus (strain ATCC 23779 / DSM 785 / 114-95) TaxID=316274 RepID=A9AV39_HERA2|nr:DUF5685 family protein [Herpetosiphon sp.]ABX03117.1 expression regulator [Herpetosiphon aurantiacus DSM 785]
MFGVLRGCSPHLDQPTHAAWWSHICGMCLTLRDQHGQVARITTNYDAALLSALYEAQRAEQGSRRTSVCALRGFRALDVVAADNHGSRYAAAVSLLMAAIRLRDNVADRDGWAGKVPLVANTVAKRWDKKAEQTARELGFEPALLRQQAVAQAEVEALVNADFCTYSAPTEAAVGAAFRHTAILANQPSNAEPLEQMGRMYGRMMLLLDSYNDVAEDQARGHFNALCATPQAELRTVAHKIFNDAFANLRQQWQRLSLLQAHLVEVLLLNMLPAIGSKAFGACKRHSLACATVLPVAAALLPAMASDYDDDPSRRDPNRAYTGPTRALKPHENPEYQGQYPQQPPYQGQYPQQPYQGYPPQSNPNDPSMLPPGSLPPASSHPVPPPGHYQDRKRDVAMGAALCCCQSRSRRHHHSHRSRIVCCDDDCCDCCQCTCCCCDATDACEGDGCSCCECGGCGECGSCCECGDCCSCDC